MKYIAQQPARTIKGHHSRRQTNLAMRLVPTGDGLKKPHKDRLLNVNADVVTKSCCSSLLSRD